MPSATPILDIRRAQAEAHHRALNSWQPPHDPVRRATAVEGIVRGLLILPRELREAVNSVFDNEPQDGTLLEYMNRHRIEVNGLFDAALGELRRARDLARESVGAGHDVPSLPALEEAIQEAEQVRTDTLAHWIEFPEGPIEIRPEDYVSNEAAFAAMSEGRNQESLRELPDRLERLGR